MGRRKTEDYSIIEVDKFVQATRDSGYKGTASAIAELIDNALQAGARTIRVAIEEVERSSGSAIEISVLDDGAGMDRRTLRHALRFGGSSRFDDRGGLGRYGMGLPNSSLSQARRVTVYSWRSPANVVSCYLDLDEVMSRRLVEIPSPTRARLPIGACPSPSGTLVNWSRCDRLDQKRISTICQKLTTAVGRRFRFYLWAGVTICINDQAVPPIDPLYVDKRSPASGAAVFGEPLRYRIRVPDAADQGRTGVVKVTFSELPVRAWHTLTNAEKRHLGIAGGAGVSVVRADREVDYGWFFMGSKRRENYDDWWRCEIAFDPVLDEVFGITHTKQQVRPQAYLSRILTPDIEATARILNSRTRKAHLDLKIAAPRSPAATLASARDQFLAPINCPPAPPTCIPRDAGSPLRAKGLCSLSPKADGLGYSIVVAATPDLSFFAFDVERGHITLILNPDHPFYKTVYNPLVEGVAEQDRAARLRLELLLLAAARSEAAAEADARAALVENRRRWSNVLSTFLDG